MPLNLCYVDFEKTLRSVWGEALVNIMRHFRILVKLERVIMNVHENNFCKLVGAQVILLR